MGKTAWTGGIIAAGEGSRLRRDGWSLPKPMVPVAGVPLIDWVIRNFVAAGIEDVVVILNEQERECVAAIRSGFPALNLRFIVKTTASSLESFGEVTRGPEEGPMVVSTVDALCAEADFRHFLARAERRPAGATVLAVTPLVADERPLWVTLGADGRIGKVGGEQGDVVTAGIYVISERVRRMTPPVRLERLRHFLGWLVEQGEPMYGEVIDTVVDVDRGTDVELAEAMILASRDVNRRGE